MGFCLFNNVAVAAAHAVAEHGVERVLVLDWDVHHGNGTEEIFYESAAVLYASIHQSPLYPGTGAAERRRAAARARASPSTCRSPPGSRARRSSSRWSSTWSSRSRASTSPGLLVISAGYDAHRDDPLAQCELDEAAYGEMAAAMRELGDGARGAGARLPRGRLRGRARWPTRSWRRSRDCRAIDAAGARPEPISPSRTGRGSRATGQYWR